MLNNTCNQYIWEYYTEKNSEENKTHDPYSEINAIIQSVCGNARFFYAYDQIILETLTQCHLHQVDYSRAQNALAIVIIEYAKKFDHLEHKAFFFNESSLSAKKESSRIVCQFNQENHTKALVFLIIIFTFTYLLILNVRSYGVFNGFKQREADLLSRNSAWRFLNKSGFRSCSILVAALTAENCFDYPSKDIIASLSDHYSIYKKVFGKQPLNFYHHFVQDKNDRNLFQLARILTKVLSILSDRYFLT